MQRTSAGILVLRRLVAAATTATLLGTVVGPGIAHASGLPPTVPDVSVTTAEDTPVTGNALTDATDPDGDTLRVTSYTQFNAALGSIAFTSSAGDYTFTPKANASGGPASITFTVSDGTNVVQAHLYMTVTPVNDPPVCPAGTSTGAEDTQQSGSVLCTDIDSGSLTYALAGQAAHGTAAIAADGSWTYDPDPNYNGTDSFTYKANDGIDDSAPATMSITITAVNDPPVATNGAITVVEDTPTNVTSQILGLASDVDGDTLTVSAVGTATGGQVELAAGTVTFTPTANLCGAAAGSFGYTVDDGNGGTDSATATVNITCVNDPPVAAADTVTVLENKAATLTTLLQNDTDIDGDTLFVSAVSASTGGTAAVNATTHVVTFTPAANVCGAAAGGFTYIASDGHGGTSSAHVTVNITCDNSPVARADTVTVVEDTLTPLTTLTSNDTDVDGDPLFVSAVSGSTGGTAAVNATTHAVTFAPAANLCGTAAGGFNYTVSDGRGGTSSAHVTVNISCVNDAPVARADTGTTGENQAAKAFLVLANDSDVDGNAIALVSASVASTQGTVRADAAGKAVWFTPAHNFVGTATVTYTITDGKLQAQGTLTVTVTPDVTGPVVATPVAWLTTGRVDESAPLRISWGASDVSGVKAYVVQVSVGGGAFATIYSGTATATTRYYAFSKTLVWRVRAQDNLGNWSGWATSATRRVLAYQDSSTSVIKSAGWLSVLSSGSSGTGYRYTTTYGRYASLQFWGLQVMYVAPRLPAGGALNLYIDGVYRGRYSTYATTTLLGQVIAGTGWTAAGTHSIKIVNAQSGRRTTLDAFLVLR